MKKKTSQHLDESSPQTVTNFIEVNNGQNAIKIGFTEQKVSPHAGLSTFVSFLHWHGWKGLLEKVLPVRTSPNAKPAIEVALSFMVGVMAGARKLAQVGYLQGDRVLPQLLGIKAMASQYSLSRYLRKFKSAYENGACFGPLWRWCVERLPSRAG